MNQESSGRATRRRLGYLAARLDELPLEKVQDPRRRKKKWSIGKLLRAVVVGIAAGCKGLGELERTTARLGSGARKALGLVRRVPDTTLRDLLVKLGPDALRQLLYRQVRIALRRKQLELDLPLRVASMDGKATATRLFDPVHADVQYGQRQGNRSVVRTITTCLVSTAARPCLDAHPVPPETNEGGAFQSAYLALEAAYGPRFLDVVMYDSGAASLENASFLHERGVDYVLCLTANQPTLLAEAQRVLAGRKAESAEVESCDQDGSDIVTRRLYRTDELAGFLDWTHLDTVVRIECIREDVHTNAIHVENRYYLTSIASQSLSSAQWLTLLRRRWSVENECHNTWDTTFQEDDRPWILLPAGMLAVMLLRRLTYNLLALYRSVTLRSEANRTRPWSHLIEDIYAALLQATEELMVGLRRRPTADS